MHALPAIDLQCTRGSTVERGSDEEEGQQKNEIERQRQIGRKKNAVARLWICFVCSSLEARSHGVGKVMDVCIGKKRRRGWPPYGSGGAG